MEWATSAVTAASVPITLAYAALLAWGIGVGARLLWQAKRRPAGLLNPLFANRHARQLFAVHMAVVSADLLLIGPLAVSNKSTLWYWGGRIATLSSSLPLAAYLNRTPQSFGRLIGRWLVFRNVFEVALHVAVAAAAVNWFHYYVLLWWVVAYRYLDVGPRRYLQRRYDTAEKLAARPRAPLLNWVVIAVLYVLAFLAVYHRKVIFAGVPADSLAPHVARPFEVALVVGYNLAVAVGAWILTRRYTDSLLSAAGQGHGQAQGVAAHRGQPAV